MDPWLTTWVRSRHRALLPFSKIVFFLSFESLCWLNVFPPMVQRQPLNFFCHNHRRLFPPWSEGEGGYVGLGLHTHYWDGFCSACDYSKSLVLHLINKISGIITCGYKYSRTGLMYCLYVVLRTSWASPHLEPVSLFGNLNLFLPFSAVNLARFVKVNFLSRYIPNYFGTYYLIIFPSNSNETGCTLVDKVYSCHTVMSEFTDIWLCLRHLNTK